MHEVACPSRSSARLRAFAFPHRRRRRAAFRALFVFAFATRFRIAVRQMRSAVHVLPCARSAKQHQNGA
eukprot:2729968-Lingulodinium_polyedra.AAC.1